MVDDCEARSHVTSARPPFLFFMTSAVRVMAASFNVDSVDESSTSLFQSSQLEIAGWPCRRGLAAFEPSGDDNGYVVIQIATESSTLPLSPRGIAVSIAAPPRAASGFN
ncbi:hypothetical protein HPB50_003903 [Hyalomma asiaticum]|uniref:Uncharacterized protein n=1 Tax=Hyalomma asiaticum TaxID=266040 RepID=A0ACB7T4B5_HYAAI|nr:hypothetical protein HPB50_003903 [Hyalomma asiaticum]